VLTAEAGVDPQLAQGMKAPPGGVQLDLGQLLPLRATMKNHAEIAMGLSAPGQEEAMTMKMETEVSLETR